MPEKQKITKPAKRAAKKTEVAVELHVPAGKYFEAVGRRKTSIARARLYESKNPAFTVNGKTIQDYFPVDELRMAATGALRKMKVMDDFVISLKVTGGGMRGQAEAARLATARALVKYNEEFHQRLKRVGYLRRDARAVERKKFGLKKARRAPQWQKR